MPSVLDLADSQSSQGIADLIDQLCAFESHTCAASYDSSAELVAAIDLFNDHYYDMHLSLISLPPATHTFALIFLVDDLARQLLVLGHALQSFVRDLPFPDPDPCIAQAGILLKILIGNLEALIVHLLTNHANLIQRFVQSASRRAHARLFLFLHSTLEIIAVDCPVTISTSILRTICSIIQEKLILDDLLDDAKSEDIFSLVVAFLRACYVSGCSSCCEPLLGKSAAALLTPEYAIANMEAYPTAYLDLVNYFKYLAFNLMEIALTRANDSDARQHRAAASVCFKILLALPSMATSNYENDPELHASNQGERSWPRKSVTLVQRLELSLLYVVNTLLLLTDLKDVLFPSSLLKTELSFLGRTLSMVLSNELTRSALQPQLLHLMEESVFNSAHHQPEVSGKELHSSGIDNSNLNCISAVLYHGLYKEKHQLIIEMCDMWSSSPLFSVENHNKKCQQVFEKYNLEWLVGTHLSGKRKYLESILDISRKLCILALKKVFVGNGLSNLPLLAVNPLLGGTNTLESLIKWDASLSFETSEAGGVKYISFTQKESLITPKTVLEMTEINDLTHTLRSLTTAL